MVSSCCFCCLSAPRLLSSASCFEIHLEGRWCSRWDWCFISLHTVQLEIWDAIGIAFLFRSSLFQAKHRWRRPQAFLMNVPPITFAIKDRLSILWREWSVMVHGKEPLLPISGLWCEMKLMCDVGCRLSFLIQNLLKSWRTKWDPGALVPWGPESLQSLPWFCCCHLPLCCLWCLWHLMLGQWTTLAKEVCFVVFIVFVI